MFDGYTKAIYECSESQCDYISFGRTKGNIAKTEFEAHLRDSHGIDVSKINIEKDRSSGFCPSCKRICKDRTQLSKHIRANGLKPHKVDCTKECLPLCTVDKENMGKLFTGKMIDMNYLRDNDPEGTPDRKIIEFLVGHVDAQVYLTCCKMKHHKLTIDDFPKDKPKAITNKSPLRYPGGKTRACKKLDDIIKVHFPNFKENYDTIVSPFFGGGSFEFYIQSNYQLEIIANDKFKPLYNFWETCKSNSKGLCDGLKVKKPVNKEDFTSMRDMIMDESDPLEQSIMYFIINRCSFSGATLSGGFSSEASEKRFTSSSIERVRQLDLCGHLPIPPKLPITRLRRRPKFEIYNLDFEQFIDDKRIGEKNLLFLDPPYYLEGGSRLYGNNGDMHEGFPHEGLRDCLRDQSKWLMTYNDCKYIRDLYKDDRFEIIEENWSYGMNKSKASSEIIIIAM